jgi:hypothetical protein
MKLYSRMFTRFFPSRRLRRNLISFFNWPDTILLPHPVDGHQLLETQNARTRDSARIGHSLKYAHYNRFGSRADCLEFPGFAPPPRDRLAFSVDSSPLFS